MSNSHSFEDGECSNDSIPQPKSLSKSSSSKSSSSSSESRPIQKQQYVDMDDKREKHQHDIRDNTGKPICRRFALSTCPDGKHCKFSHLVKYYPCKYKMAHGHCKRDNCPFFHNISTLTRKESIQVIKDNTTYFYSILKEKKYTRIGELLIHYLDDKFPKDNVMNKFMKLNQIQSGKVKKQKEKKQKAPVNQNEYNKPLFDYKNHLKEQEEQQKQQNIINYTQNQFTLNTYQRPVFPVINPMAYTMPMVNANMVAQPISTVPVGSGLISPGQYVCPQFTVCPVEEPMVQTIQQQQQPLLKVQKVEEESKNALKDSVKLHLSVFPSDEQKSIIGFIQGLMEKPMEGKIQSMKEKIQDINPFLKEPLLNIFKLFHTQQEFQSLELGLV